MHHTRSEYASPLLRIIRLNSDQLTYRMPNTESTCGEASWFVTLCEVYCEVCDEGLNVVISTAVQAEWWRECQLIQCNRIHVNFLQPDTY